MRAGIPAGSTRTCEECGRAYAKVKREPASQWLKRRFCSHACADAGQLRARSDIETASGIGVQKATRCWLWQGAPYGGGYGQFNYANKRYYAHVFSLKLDGRPVPKSQRGLHHCDNKLCVTPKPTIPHHLVECKRHGGYMEPLAHSLWRPALGGQA